MYQNALVFFIVSDSDYIEKILMGIQSLTDCDYTFHTISCFEEAGEDIKKPDVAVIYDNVSSEKLPHRKDGCNECIFVAGKENDRLTDKDIVSVFNDVWIMPKGGQFDDALLALYFGRLAKRMKYKADARKQGICFDTLINSVPDISWFKDVSGAHLIVNSSFCEMVGKTKEQIYKQGHCFIWDASKEDEEVCLNSDQIIMDSRKTNTFEENIKTKNDIRMLKSYKSALIDVDGQIFGTCGIAHDITELRDMSTELDIVLDSMPYAVLVENTQDIVINKNTRFDDYFPEFIDIVGKSSAEWKQSLSKKLLFEDSIKEVVTQSGDEERILVFDEEPIRDTSQRVIGKMVTLTDITVERSIAQKNEHRANVDFLTGLANRRNLMSYLENNYMRDDVTLVMLDLDNFKHVNDTYGHEAGDKALVKTAEIMRDCFRDDFISRMGGDEFMVVISGKDTEQIKRETEKLLSDMGNEYMVREEFNGITVSAGIVTTADIPKEKRNISYLVKTADRMLYKAKNNGKNCYFVYGEDKNE